MSMANRKETAGGLGPVLVALGANLPHDGRAPRATLEAALALVEAQGWRVAALSRFFRTPAYPPGSGPDFVNACARLEPGPGATAEAGALLAVLHGVEAALGRERRTRWAPRACDLDLLAIGQAVLPDRRTAAGWMALDPAAQRRAAPEGPVLPHPRLHERIFVLAPLAEVAPDWRHPLTGASVSEMLAALPAADRASIAAL